MALEDKSIHQLRAIAEAIGVPVDFSLDKSELLTKIRDAAPSAANFPKVSKPDRLELQLKSFDELTNFLNDNGIIYEANYANNTIRMTRYTHTGIKDDSVNMTAPIRVILQCARKLLED